MIKNVIFDLDGVICFTDHYHYLAWKELADEIGVYFDEEINNRLRGVSRMASLEIILERATKEYTPEEKEQMAEKKNTVYRRLLQEMTPNDLPPAVRETLLALRAKGYRLAIGSSSKNTPTILAQIGLADFFDAVSDGNNITNSKPHPEVFLKAAEYLGAPSTECAVVEDAIAGVAAGHNAGMLCFALGDAAKAGAGDRNMETIAELPRILEELNHG